MKPEAFEVTIETAWFDLRLAKKPRTYYLTPARRLLWGYHSGLEAGREIGTYTSKVTLEDFRSDCFHVLEEANA
jgi:hypothetical protein